MSTPTSKLTIPQWLMDDWNDWRNKNGYTPRVVQAALWTFMKMEPNTSHAWVEKYGRSWTTPGTAKQLVRQQQPPTHVLKLAGTDEVIE